MKIYSINKYLFSYNLFLFFLLNYNLFSQAILPTFYGIQAKNNYSLELEDIILYFDDDWKYLV